MNDYPTIDLPDVTNQDAVQRFFGEIRNPRTGYLRVQDGANYFLVYYPAAKKSAEKNDKVSDEVTQKRLAALERARVLSQEVAELWCTDETAAEAVANSRR